MIAPRDVDQKAASMAAAVHETSWGEQILRLRVGESAPAGFEIKRILGYWQVPTGAGTNYEEVYAVAVRRVA